MPASSNEYRLDFVIKDGIGKGRRVTLTQQNIDFHIQKYGNDRPELNQDEFYDLVKEAMEKPDVVYPRIKIDANGKVNIIKNVYVFYKENVERRYEKNGMVVKHYARVVVRKVWSNFQKGLEIVTPFYSPRINEERRCQPTTKI